MTPGPHRELPVESLRQEESVGMLDARPSLEPKGREPIKPGDEVLGGGVREGDSYGLKKIHFLRTLCRK